MKPVDPTSLFAKSLFFGLIPEDLAFPYPRLGSSDKADALALFLESIRRFGASQIDSREIDETSHIPYPVLQGLRSLGLFGMSLPEQYGGSGLDHRMFCRVMQEVASIDASVALTLGAHQTVGTRGLLLYGTEEQKRRYLPRLASGEWIAAFALTEPEAGSDAASITTRAEPSADGSHFVLTGRKQWISNGGLARLFTVFAKTSVETAGRRRDRITAFLVERGFGLESGSEEDKLGIRGSSATSLFLDGVKVPRENVLGELGQGFKIAQEVLGFGRLSLAAGCLGCARTAIGLALEHARNRRQFGKPIADFDMIRSKFAQMAIDLYACESMVYLTAGVIDAGIKDFGIEAACCKVFASEMLWQVANEAMQICGGSAYMRAYPYERMLRDARINLIFNGTNEILRLFISLGGMAAPGERLAQLSGAIRRPVSSYGLVADFVLQKLRTTVYGERLSRAHPALRREAAVLEDYVIELEQAVDRALRKHGGRIVEFQHIHSRVADVVIDLYALVACIARTSSVLEREVGGDPNRATLLCRAFAAQAHDRLRRNLRRVGSKDDDTLTEVAEALYEAGGYTREPLEE
jgi:acyl-CoA dehydrogenase family protein 9